MPGPSHHVEEFRGPWTRADTAGAHGTRSGAGAWSNLDWTPDGTHFVSALGAGVNNLTDGGSLDLVVDNFIYGEPKAF